MLSRKASKLLGLSRLAELVRLEAGGPAGVSFRQLCKKYPHIKESDWNHVLRDLTGELRHEWSPIKQPDYAAQEGRWFIKGATHESDVL
jgi:hypothetical protein